MVRIPFLLLVVLLVSAPARADGLQPVLVESGEGSVTFHVELADTPAKRKRGLMFRESLPADQGMLFDFGESRPVAMWMRNTLIPLDMIFIDESGRVVNVVTEAAPLSTEIRRSEGPARAVLELRGGTADRLGIGPGTRIHHPLFEDAR